MSYAEKVEVEEACYRIAENFECAWPIMGLVHTDIISRAALALAISARRDVEGLNDHSSVSMGEAKIRAVLLDHLAAAVVKFEEFCELKPNSVFSGLSRADKTKVKALFTHDVAEAFRIHMDVAAELVKKGMPIKEIAVNARRISIERIIDNAVGPVLPEGNYTEATQLRPHL